MAAQMPTGPLPPFKAERLANQLGLNPNDYGSDVRGTWTNQALANALNINIIKSGSTGGRILASPMTTQPTPTTESVLSQATNLGDAQYRAIQSPLSYLTQKGKDEYTGYTYPRQLERLQAQATGLNLTPEQLNTAYNAGQQNAYKADQDYIEWRRKNSGMEIPTWFKVASALAGAHMVGKGFLDQAASSLAPSATNAGATIGSTAVPAFGTPFTGQQLGQMATAAVSGYRNPQFGGASTIINTVLPSPMDKQFGLPDLEIFKKTKERIGLGDAQPFAGGGLVQHFDGGGVFAAPMDSGITPDTIAALKSKAGYANAPSEALKMLRKVYGEGVSNLESILRGSAAAIPGFAGDIGQGFDIRGLRSLPTTEQILSKVPRLTTPTKEGAGFEEVGTYLPLPVTPTNVKQGLQAVQRGVKGGARVVGEELNRAVLDNSGVLARFVPEAAKPLYVVKPAGNINLQPVLSKEILRGPDVQSVESFLSQAKATPGVTKDAFIELASKYDDLAPTTKMSKADFEARIPPSRYDKVDLPGSVGNNDEVMEQAYDLVNEDGSAVFEMVLDRLNIRRIPEGQYRNYIDALQEYHLGNIGPEEMPAPLRRALERDGMIENPQLYHNLVQDEFDEAVRHTAQQLEDYVETTASGYRHEDYQRLLPQDTRNALDQDHYVEFGVTHPDRAGVSYHHYPGYDNSQDGLIGHVRGTLIPAMKKDAVAYVPGVGKNREVIQLKPNSFIVEEIQSDAQKGAFSAEQTGALRQVHGTLFKAAIEEAIQRGADTVYYPTANTIAAVRGGDPKPYAAIYDQQIVREGLKPLGKIPGVEIKPIETMVRVGNRTPQPVVAYYEITLTPEAKKYIMSGPGQLAPGYAPGGLFKMLSKYLGRETAKEVVKEAPKEQKMLVGVQQRYTNELPGEIVYHAGAEFKTPRPGLFTTPDRVAAEKFQRSVGAKRLHKLEARPRSTGSDEDVYAMAKRLGIYEPDVPASQYLEQGENAIYPESKFMVEELRNMGFDSLRLKDGMSKSPSLVILDPAILQSFAAPKEQKMLQGVYRGYAGENTPAKTAFGTDTYFVSPQKRVADYYAQRRAAELDAEPHAEMILVDPATLRNQPYGLSIPIDKYNRDFLITRARRVDPDEVKSRTPLYAAGGVVDYDPDEISKIAADVMASAAVPEGSLIPENTTLPVKVMGMGDERAGMYRGQFEIPVGEYTAGIGAGGMYYNTPAGRKFTLSGRGISGSMPFLGGRLSGSYYRDPNSNLREARINYSREFAAGGLAHYDPSEIDTIVSRMKEEFHG